MLESRVSDDVFNEIFLAFGAVTRRDDHWAPSPGPIFLASVCRRWRAVIHSSPRLWTSIRIHINHHSRFPSAVKLILLFIARSGACPLEAAINFSHKGREHNMSSVEEEHCRSLVNAIVVSIERWQCFRTNGHPAFLYMIEQVVAERSALPFPILESLVIQPHMGYIWPGLRRNDYSALTVFAASPKLRDVQTIGRGILHGAIPYIQLPWQQLKHLAIHVTSKGCMQILRDCPNLTKLSVALRSNSEWGESVTLLHESLRYLEIRVYEESTFHCFFESAKLPSLSNLIIYFTWAWDPDQSPTQKRFISFLPTCFMLQKIILKLVEVKPEDWHAILRALPAGLVELEIRREKRCCAGITYSNKLFEELTLNPGRDAPELLPNLHTLSLLGALALRMDAAAFTAMIRSRTNEKYSTEGSVMLQSLRIDIGEHAESITIQELGEVKAIMGDRADIRMVPLARRG